MLRIILSQKIKEQYVKLFIQGAHNQPKKILVSKTRKQYKNVQNEDTLTRLANSNHYGLIFLQARSGFFFNF